MWVTSRWIMDRLKYFYSEFNTQGRRGEMMMLRRWAVREQFVSGAGGGGKGVTSAWSPLGNFLQGQAHPNLSSNQGFLFFLREVFCVCFPVVQGFSLRLLCLFSNSFQFKFFIYSLYIHIYIFYIFFHCTCGALQCSHGL